MAGIGAYKQRVTFQSYTATADGAGGNTETTATPVVILSTWARVTDRGSSRSLNDFVDTIQKRKQVDVFYRSALTALNKSTHILYNGVEYAIESKEMVNEEKKILRFEAVAAT